MTPQYHLMMYYAHSRLESIRDELLIDDNTTVENFREVAQNEDCCKIIFDECLTAFNYELSYNQMVSGINLLLQSHKASRRQLPPDFPTPDEFAKMIDIWDNDRDGSDQMIYDWFAQFRYETIVYPKVGDMVEGRHGSIWVKGRLTRFSMATSQVEYSYGTEEIRPISTLTREQVLEPTKVKRPENETVGEDAKKPAFIPNAPIKPPLGLRPRNVADAEYREMRIKEITDAMNRYINGDKPIPSMWSLELMDLLRERDEAEMSSIRCADCGDRGVIADWLGRDTTCPCHLT